MTDASTSSRSPNRSPNPRLLVIMGSGETAPTMRATHRSVFERLARTRTEIAAIILDTPFGFQENASILADQTVKYFADSVGREVVAAGLTRTDIGDVATIESGIARVRDADWVFAGPGSPTFALRQWRDTSLPEVLRDKLRPDGLGGAVVFSSAAALTLGCATVPVYEIYKVGCDPWWEPGLDLLAGVGINAAVVPHYDNAEGGNHDTRFCYLGEQRLAMIEPELPDGAFVLGVDEHTGIILDLDADTAEIVGKGAVTLRRTGESTRIESGRIVSIDALRAGATENTPSSSTATSATTVIVDTTETDRSVTGSTGGELSLAARSALLEDAFNDALVDRNAAAAVAAVLNLIATIDDWSADTLQSDEMDQAKRALRSMIVKLGDAATIGLRDERDVLGPVVRAALAARRIARDEKIYAVSDAVRDGLAAAGIEVRDTPTGDEWYLL